LLFAVDLVTEGTTLSAKLHAIVKVSRNSQLTWSNCKKVGWSNNWK